MNKNRLLTPAEVGAEYGLEQKKLANWRFRGKGPKWSKPEGCGVYYRKADIDEWFDKGERGLGKERRVEPTR